MADELTDGAAAAEEEPVYVARKLAEAKRLEEIFTKSGVDYTVEPDVYQGGVIFRSARVGAFFYVAPHMRERAITLMRENGFPTP